MNRLQSLAYLGMSAVTLVLWCILYFLMAVRLEPTVLGPPPDLLAKESYPCLSISGCSLWALLLAIHAYVVSRIVTRKNDLSSACLRWVSAGAFVISCAFVAVIHPDLMLTILLPYFGSPLTVFIERHLPLLSCIYFHWGFQRLLPLWPFVHLALITAYLFAARGILHRQRERRRVLQDDAT